MDQINNLLLLINLTEHLSYPQDINTHHCNHCCCWRSTISNACSNSNSGRSKGAYSRNLYGNHAFRNCNQTRLAEFKKNTLTIATEGTLEASNVRFSTVFSSRIPSGFAKILTPLSFVETANNIPSLLNLIQGEACRFQDQYNWLTKKFFK